MGTLDWGLRNRVSGKIGDLLSDFWDKNPVSSAIPSPFFVGWVERYLTQGRCWVTASTQPRNP